MKKIFFMLFTVTILAVSANAQDNAMPSGKPKMKMGKEGMMKMKQHRDSVLTQSLKDVGANDDQIAQAKSAMEDFGHKHHDLDKDAALSEDDKKAKNKELKEAQEAKMKEILGEEKFKKLKENRKRDHKGHEGGMKHED